MKTLNLLRPADSKETDATAEASNTSKALAISKEEDELNKALIASLPASQPE